MVDSDVADRCGWIVVARNPVLLLLWSLQSVAPLLLLQDPAYRYWLSSRQLIGGECAISAWHHYLVVSQL